MEILMKVISWKTRSVEKGK
jgi:hypothetical protein